MSDVYAVIMAGGRGERFWPLSTEDLPKPFVRLLGPRTLVQETVKRLQPLVPLERILVSIAEAQRGVAREQLPELPEENFIVEPAGRDTSACLGFCALHIERREAEAVMLAVPADHHVSDPEAFRRTLQKGIRNLPGSTAVVFGIRPARPDTGYGYIQTEKAAISDQAWPVVRFVEKPDAQTAARYVSSGNFFWNSGLFLWRNATLLELFEKHMPDSYRGLLELRPLIGRDNAHSALARVFASLPRISVDYGILEKTSGLRLVPAEFGWDDIGNWTALERALPGDADGNVALGPSHCLQSGGCITYSDAGTVAVFGITDLVVVQARGRVLVCPKEKAADLKRLVSSMDSDQR
jgi:mannose-1-phosphate guanylyltransferase